MRQVWKFPLPHMSAEFEISQSVDVPVGSQLVRFAVPVDPTIWLLVNPVAERETRTYRIYGTGHDIPDHACHVGTFQRGPFVWHVFDITPREPDVPATPDLPDAERSHFVTLWRDGFRLGPAVRDPQHPTLPPVRAWIAPDAEPLTYEQIIAVASLQEYGYGAVVSG